MALSTELREWLCQQVVSAKSGIIGGATGFGDDPDDDVYVDSLIESLRLVGLTERAAAVAADRTEAKLLIADTLRNTPAAEPTKIPELWLTLGFAARGKELNTILLGICDERWQAEARGLDGHEAFQQEFDFDYTHYCVFRFDWNRLDDFERQVREWLAEVAPDGAPVEMVASGVLREVLLKIRSLLVEVIHARRRPR